LVWAFKQVLARGGGAWDLVVRLAARAVPAAGDRPAATVVL
jgi:hypothetical protein